jgi:Ca-activated chloride channel family protein
MLSFVSHDREWKLDELANEAGVSPRTVRYYVQRGLLLAPVFRGRDTVYSTEHLERLRAIRRLQEEQYLPLDAIEGELERASRDELRRIADGSRPAKTHHPPPRPSETHHERWERWTLAPGLELHLSTGADAQTRALAEELRERAKGGS